MRLRKSISVIFFSFVLIAQPACGGPLDEALDALANKIYERALKRLEPLASEGNAAAQYWLGVMYNKGQGVQQDYVKAAKWYRKAADAGYFKAQTNLGVLYANGHGVKQDYREAVAWFLKAAAQNDAEAQHNLGISFATGQGVTLNYETAASWFRKAAQQGFARLKSGCFIIMVRAYLKISAKPFVGFSSGEQSKLGVLVTRTW